VTAPIPGSILSVYVKVGDTVAAGEPLLKMEAMKMENEINARIGGTVTAVNVQEGDSVSQGQELVLVSPQ
jgi:biotin carboxyl carrier protein